MVIGFALLLGLVSLLLSAVFSGTETAFYRVSRLRLKLDTLGGDATAKRFLWLANNPGFFISTLLIGNNTVNYGASLAMVLFLGAVLPNAGGVYAELASTLILTPILFVGGEMFPKYLSLNIPNRMLRFFAPVIHVACWVFMPLAILLWGINKIIALLLQKPQESTSLLLGRSELSGILGEGKNSGILSETQRRLAEGIFNCSDRMIKDYLLPTPMQPTITMSMKPEDVLEIARHYHQLALPVYEPGMSPKNRDLPVGYVRTIDLEIAVRHQLDEQSRQLSQLLQTELPLRSMVELSAHHSLLTGLLLLQTMHCTFGCVINEHRRCLGFISTEQLQDVLLGKAKHPDASSFARRYHETL